MTVNLNCIQLAKRLLEKQQTQVVLLARNPMSGTTDEYHNTHFCTSTIPHNYCFVTDDLNITAEEAELEIIESGWVAWFVFNELYGTAIISTETDAEARVDIDLVILQQVLEELF